MHSCNGFPQMPERALCDGVALVRDRNPVGSGVTFCFTERTGGVSQAPFESLNLGLAGGDDPSCVLENRRRVMAALGAEDLVGSLALPRQVHGDHVAVIDGTRSPEAMEAELDAGCDAVVCTVADQAVMLLFADCAPVVLTAPGGFAVVHSGWRGTLAGIAGKACSVLAEACGCAADEIGAVIGPHIGAASYEVSLELSQQFVDRFGESACRSYRHLDLSACITASLAEAGVDPRAVVDCDLDTAVLTDRFFSHRAENGVTGRHAAVAFMRY